MPTLEKVRSTSVRFLSLPHGLVSALFLLFVFTSLAYSEPLKVAELTGRGCSTPLWSPDDRVIAYTTIDHDELYVVVLDVQKTQQSSYRVANAEGVGRRYVFVPGEDRLAFRRKAGALTGAPDRVVSSSFYMHDPLMLSSNLGPIIGPYCIENKLFIRESLAHPLTSIEGQEWRNSATLINSKLELRNAAGEISFASEDNETVEGFELSPDGNWVTAVFLTKTGRQVRLIQVSEGRQIDLGKGRWPAWSGDSNRIVIVRDKPEIDYAELLVYDLSLGRSLSVTGVNRFWPDEPSLNSNGTKVAFVHKGEIYVTEVTGF